MPVDENLGASSRANMNSIVAHGRPMVKSFFLSLVAVATTFALLAQEKPALSEDEGKIMALESIWNRAEQSKDINALSKLFAPNMIYVDHDGALQTREQFFNSVKNDSSPLDQLVTEEVITRSFGESIVVTGVYRGKSTKNGKVTLTRGRFTDTWAKINGNWQCVASQSTPITH
jgi:ketosteroid isomerase-like protein